MRNSSLPTLLIGRLFRSMTRTFSVTSSVLMVSRSPSLISAVVGSGVGVGLGLRIGGGGGAPSWGTARRLGFVWGVAGWGCGFLWGVGVGVAAPVCLGRLSTGCCAKPETERKITAATAAKEADAAIRPNGDNPLQ